MIDVNLEFEMRCWGANQSDDSIEISMKEKVWYVWLGFGHE